MARSSRLVRAGSAFLLLAVSLVLFPPARVAAAGGWRGAGFAGALESLSRPFKGAASYLFAQTPTGPQIDSLSPTSVTRSGLLTVEGRSFGAAQGASQLSVGGAAALVVSWSDTRLLAYVPEASAAGDVAVRVTTAAGTDEATVGVTSRQPQGYLRWGFTLASDPPPPA
jgi:hypothetical protein